MKEEADSNKNNKRDRQVNREGIRDVQPYRPRRCNSDERGVSGYREDEETVEEKAVPNIMTERHSMSEKE